MSKIFQPNINEELVNQYVNILKNKINIFQDGRFSAEPTVNNQSIKLGKTELNLLLYRKPAQFIPTNTHKRDPRTIQVLYHVTIADDSISKALLPEINAAVTKLNEHLQMAYRIGFKDNSIVYQTNANPDHFTWKEEDAKNSAGYRK